MKYGSPSDENEGIERSTYEEQQQNNISETLMMIMMNIHEQNQVNLIQHLVQMNCLNYSFQRWRTIYFYPTQKEQLKII